MIRHTSRQWAVGHGGFCTAEIRAGHGGGVRPIRYVYDCGAMRRSLLHEAVAGYLAQVAADSGEIDLVILSHVDWDHVNGLSRLLTDPQVRVARVMLPYLSPIERLLAIARSSVAMEDEDGVDPDDPVVGGGSTGPEGFELDLMLDPATALRGLDPDIEVIFVDGGDGDDQEGVGPAPAPIEDFTPLLREPAALGDLGMLAVGSGPVNHDPHTGESRLSDRNAVRVHESTQWAKWLLAPYVSPHRHERVREFMSAAAAAFGLSESELESHLADRDEARQLVVDKRSTLRDLYRQHGGTNASSMCLYSGPIPQGGTALSETRDGNGAVLAHTDLAGTLLTGDAELKGQRDIDALVAHYGPLVPLVGTLHLPHHGSWHNISPDLLAALPHLHLTMGMTPTTSDHHPATETMHALAARGVGAHLVTAEPGSAVSTTAEAT